MSSTALAALSLAACSAALVCVCLRWLRARKPAALPHHAALYSCACGLVKARVLIPLADVGKCFNVACFCDDCLGFARAIEGKTKEAAAQGGVEPVHTSGCEFAGSGGHSPQGHCSVVEECGCVVMANVFKDQFEFVCGADRMRFARLRPSSPLLRTYTDCCATPFGLVPAALPWYPMLVLYRRNFTTPGDWMGPPAFQVFCKWASAEGRSRARDDPVLGGVPAAQTIPAGFFLVLIKRFFYALLAGRGQPNPWPLPPAESVEILHVAGEEREKKTK